MSSFMCKPETIGMIADLMCSYVSFDDPKFACDEGSIYSKRLNGEHCTRDDIYQRLWNMNAHALTVRYTDHAVTEMVGEYELYPEMPLRYDAGAVKRFDCFLYQCSEGDIPNSKEYREVEEVRDDLMGIIVRGSEDYEWEEWG